ncbi:MAG: L-aspartate oxidase [Polyangia bacterium]|jgi:L-aspartate oxidase|nr:L-aspartate oxidase [Polyangia bacterium]
MSQERLPPEWDTDTLVLGSGIAGLWLALRAAEQGHVTVVTKADPEESNTAYAQGGIASVLDPGDSFERHIQDTLRAGAGLCRREIVEIAVREGPALIRELSERYGVAFDLRPASADESPTLDLGLEGGHSARRVAHVADATGQTVAAKLLEAARSNPNIHVLGGHMAVDLLTMAKHGGPDAVFGAFVLERFSGEVFPLLARRTVLATGGAGKVYLYTSNPDVATGDGVAMAYRAGAAVADMEFMQFHPTCLFHPQAKSFLISEALRGEGGKLRLMSGARFMDAYHELGELAPRDAVARAIDAELKRTGDDHVLLDMTELPSDFLVNRFPTIHARCMSYGIDMRAEPIPVVPAAHYHCGGVVTDQDGRTSVQNLFAIGEVACTGLHGANRLASNSLLEGLVFANRAAAVLGDASGIRPRARPSWETRGAIPEDEAVIVAHNWDEIRRLMWNYVSIVRSERRLERARRRIALIREEIREYYSKFLVTPDTIELRNLALVADLIVAGALKRKESRGLHFMVDHPETDPNQARPVVFRGSGPHN